MRHSAGFLKESSLNVTVLSVSVDSSKVNISWSLRDVRRWYLLRKNWNWKILCRRVSSRKSNARGLHYRLQKVHALVTVSGGQFFTTRVAQFEFVSDSDIGLFLVTTYASKYSSAEESDGVNELYLEMTPLRKYDTEPWARRRVVNIFCA